MARFPRCRDQLNIRPFSERTNSVGQLQTFPIEITSHHRSLVSHNHLEPPLLNITNEANYHQN